MFYVILIILSCVQVFAAEVEIHSNEKILTKEESYLCTAGVGPCQAIIFYDSVSHLTYFNHRLMLSSLSELEKDIEEFKAKVTYLDAVRVYVIGLSTSYANLEEIKAERSMLSKMLTDNFSRVLVRWLPMNSSADVYFNVSNGDLRIDLVDTDYQGEHEVEVVFSGAIREVKYIKSKEHPRCNEMLKLKNYKTSSSLFTKK